MIFFSGKWWYEKVFLSFCNLSKQVNENILPFLSTIETVVCRQNFIGFFWKEMLKKGLLRFLQLKQAVVFENVVEQIRRYRNPGLWFYFVIRHVVVLVHQCLMKLFFQFYQQLFLTPTFRVGCFLIADKNVTTQRKIAACKLQAVKMLLLYIL